MILIAFLMLSNKQNSTKIKQLRFLEINNNDVLL